MTLALIFKVNVISGIGGLIGREQIGCESIIPDHDIDHCVNIVGWLDVSNSEQGDFRCRGAVDIPISYFVLWCINLLADVILTKSCICAQFL